MNESDDGMSPESTAHDGGNEPDPVLQYEPAPPDVLRFVPGSGWVRVESSNPTREDRAYHRRLAKRRAANRVAKASRRRNRT
jgi:hypothetical protein